MAASRHRVRDPVELFPAGTVTFAFTDIEGSTSRWEQDRAAMQDAVRRHDAIVRGAIERHGGYVFKTIGDAFCAAFSRPEDALGAMLEAQHALTAEDFSAVDGLRVRAALHTGSADARDGDYSGPPLNKVARLLAIGYGGQVLLSEETAVLIRGSLTPDASLRDLGTYRFKDFAEPQRVHQLVTEGLRRDFPPLRSLGTLSGDASVIDTREFHPVLNFSGREDELAAVDAALAEDGAIVVVHGLGGVGKSSIAREYGRRSRERYSVVWWLNAQTEDGIIDGLLRLGTMFVEGLDQLKDRRAAAHRVLHSVLSGFERPVLLVFDNLEDEGVMRAWLPRTARALATSRVAAWGADVVLVPLQTWSRQIAIDYLLHAAGRADVTPDDAREIAETLGALPLALAHAAATLRKLRNVKGRRYLEHIKEHLRNAPRGADYPQSIFATFGTAISQAEHHAPGAAAVLSFAASFAPDAIPDELVRQAVESTGEALRPALSDDCALDLRSAVADELALDEALGALDQLSLLTFVQGSRTYSMHRLVQLAARDLAAQGSGAWAENAVQAAEAAFPQQIDIATWPLCERLLPHARAAIDGLASDTAFLPAGRLAYRCSDYLCARGEYPAALQMGLRALAIQEKVLGLDHLDVAGSLNVLGRVYWRQGRFPEAESLQTRALAIREAALGPEHLDVAESLNNIALARSEQGRYSDAELLNRRALAIREAALGPDHPHVALSLNNLAVTSLRQGRRREVEPLYARAVAIWEKALGPDHPHVAFGLNNLAGLHLELGRIAEAERLVVRSVAIREKVLGPDHPEFAMSLNHLALVYKAQARYAEAEAAHLQALAIREKAFEPDRPDVAQTLSNLADVYREMERYAEAESLIMRALPIREQTLGSDHPDVAESLTVLADVYRCERRHDEAEPLLARALAIREKSLTPDHPDLAVSLNVLALLRADERRFAEAEAAQMRALSIREKAFGTEHPEVAESLHNLAGVQRAQGRRSEAEAALFRALAIREKTLGRDHPATKATRNALAELPVESAATTS